MEKTGKVRFLLAVTFCAALAAFAYSMGRQSGERDTRDLMQRAVMERRMAAVIDADHDLYMGDEDFEHDNNVPADPTGPTGEGFANTTASESSDADEPALP